MVAISPRLCFVVQLFQVGEAVMRAHDQTEVCLAAAAGFAKRLCRAADRTAERRFIGHRTTDHPVRRCIQPRLQDRQPPSQLPNACTAIPNPQRLDLQPSTSTTLLS